jgi:heme oxygenase
MSALLQAREHGYERFLIATSRVVLPLERGLSRCGVSEIVPDWPLRSRTAALREDLQALSLPEPAPSAVYEDRRLLEEAYMLGVLYVLEGSRLGARALVNKIAAPDRCQATSYLSHGQGLPLWQNFLTRLEASTAVRSRPERAVAGASVAFVLFLREATTMQHNGHERQCGLASSAAGRPVGGNDI